MKKQLTEIEKLRNGFKIFLLAKLAYRFDRGDFDEDLKSFSKGDSLTIDSSVTLIPNDIIFIKALTNTKIDKKIYDKVKRMWDKEEKLKKRKWPWQRN